VSEYDGIEFTTTAEYGMKLIKENASLQSRLDKAVEQSRNLHDKNIYLQASLDRAAEALGKLRDLFPHESRWENGQLVYVRNIVEQALAEIRGEGELK